MICDGSGLKSARKFAHKKVYGEETRAVRRGVKYIPMIRPAMAFAISQYHFAPVPFFIDLVVDDII